MELLEESKTPPMHVTASYQPKEISCSRGQIYISYYCPIRLYLPLTPVSYKSLEVAFGIHNLDWLWNVST